MSTRGFSANIETLMFLGWAARSGLQETMREAHNKRQLAPRNAAPDRVLRAQITYSQPPVFEADSTYGSLYEALFTYRLDRVDFQLVDWALRAYNAVHLKEADEAVENEAECLYSTPETGLLWEAITQNESLLFRVKRIGREWKGEVRKVANALRLHFTYQTPLLMRTPESSFLFQEFISMSLEQVNWFEIAALVLEVPYQPEMAQEEEEREGDYEAMQLALLKEMFGGGDFFLQRNVHEQASGALR